MHHKYTDLFFVLLVTVIGGIIAIISNVGGFIRILFTLPLVLVLPGYALSAALFAKRKMEFPEKLAFSLGLSLAVGVLGGLVLNLTPWGLQTGSWVVLLGGFTIGAACVAMLRRRQDQAIPMVRPALGVRQGLLFGLALAVVGAALAVALLGALRQPTQGFTQLWILPGEGADQDTVQLGVRNMETSEVSYRVELRIGEKVVGDWALVELQPGEEWKIEFVLPQRQSDIEMVEAVLYREDSPDTIYRRVTLWRVK